MFTVNFTVKNNYSGTKFYGFIAENGCAVINSDKGVKVWKRRSAAEKAAAKIVSTEKFNVLAVSIKNLRG